MITDFNITKVYGQDSTPIPIDDIIELKESDISVTGIDFFTNESITCKIKFYENSDVLDLLIGNNDTIEDTQFLEYIFVFKKNGEWRRYYIDRNKIKWDKKAKEITVTAEDLSGLVFELLDREYEFDTSTMNPVTKTISLIESRLGDTDLDGQLYNIVDNSIDFSLVNSKVFNSDVNISWGYPSTYNPLEGDCAYVIEAPYHYFIRWKWVGNNQGQRRLYYFYWLHNEDQSGDWSTHIVHLEYKIKDSGINLIRTFKQISQTSGHSDKSGYDDYPTEIDGLPLDTCKLTHTENNGDDSWEISGKDLYYTGDTKVTEINYAESGAHKIKDAVKKFCYLNNIAIISNRSTNLNLETRFNETAGITTILDNEVIEYELEPINWGDTDWKREFDEFENTGQYSNALYTLYDYLKETITEKVNMKIINEHSLSILDRINVFGNDYTIIGINIDNDNQLYTVEAWR